MKNYFLTGTLAILAALIPSPLFAASCGYGGPPRDFGGFVCLALDLVTTAIPIVAAIALLVFFWGLAKFILHAGDDKSHETGKELMKWGIISLFVMVSVWGIVLFLTNDIFGISLPSLHLLPT